MARGNRNNPTIMESLRNAWKVGDIRKKLIYTFFMLVLFRLVGVIPAPGVDYTKVHAFLDQDPGARAADLALIEPDRVHHAFHHAVEVGIVKHDERRLPAQLE